MEGDFRVCRCRATTRTVRGFYIISVDGFCFSILGSELCASITTSTAHHTTRAILCGVLSTLALVLAPVLTFATSRV